MNDVRIAFREDDQIARSAIDMGGPGGYMLTVVYRDGDAMIYVDNDLVLTWVNCDELYGTVHVDAPAIAAGRGIVDNMEAIVGRALSGLRGMYDAVG